MKHLRYWTLSLLAFTLFLRPLAACGPDFPTAVFVLPDAPDGDYARFAAGHLGVLQPGFHSRSLAVAYLALTSHPLSAEAQQQAVAANLHFVNPSSDGTSPWDGKPLPGFAAWIKARSTFGVVAGYMPDGTLKTDRSHNGNDYDTFTNCLDNAFTTATATLAARQQLHGAQDPAVVEWVRGQDAVFSNCGDGIAPRYYGPGKPPPAPPAPHAPATAAANTPVWLRQDRAYQLAAAQFYAMHYDDALAGFRSIAADTASPWSTTARYLEARTLLRKAQFGDQVGGAPQPADDSGVPLTAEQRAARVQLQQQRTKAIEAARLGTLQQAQHELLAMQNEPRMAPMRDSIHGLLDYLNARLQPEAQTITLAQRLLDTDTPVLKQTLIDFTALHTAAQTYGSLGLQQASDPAAAKKGGSANRPAAATHLQPASDLALWVDTLNNEDAATALAEWRATPTKPWLVAAIMFATPASPDTPALLAAAEAVPETDPAWLTVTYHRLRLRPPGSARRAELLALLTKLRPTEGPSTINLFAEIAAVSSPSLEDWLALAARTPAGEDSWSDTGAQPVDPPAANAEDICGHPAHATQQLFDTDAAVALNQQIPLRMLASAAESQILPVNLRFQLAEATLTRAVLLDQPAVANRMAPILEACRAAWKPVLDTYAAASAPGHAAADLHAAGLLALMRFPSTEPSVREGEERRQGFATYDDLRQNWWCTTVPLPTEDVDSQPNAWFPGRDPDAPYGSDPAGMTTHPHVVPPPPAFLTPADLTEATAEAARLRAIPNASTWFAQQAIAWYAAHPTDARTPEILGEAFRVVRNGCRHDPEGGKPAGPDNTATYAHALFDLLHQNFPNDVWTRRYSTWE